MNTSNEALKKKSAVNFPPLPLDVQSFKKIARSKFLYVDKTGFIAQLINNQLTYFFLSRPRRFGKSLLVSTMKKIFNCSKINIWSKKQEVQTK